MTTSRMHQIRGFEDARLESFAKRMASLLILAATKAAAHTSNPSSFPIPDDKASLEQLFLKRLMSLDSKKRRAAAENAITFVNADAELKRKAFAELADLDLRSKESLSSQMRAMPTVPNLQQAVRDVKSISDLFTPYMPPEALHLMTLNALEPGISERVVRATRLASQPSPSQLTFSVSLRGLVCVDETGTEPFNEVFEDEIELGGTSIDARGRIGKLVTLRIKTDQGNDFEDGDSKTFSPPKGYAAINLNDGFSMPKWVFVVFTLAELDEGGFADFLNELYSHIRDKIIEEFANAGFDVGGVLAGPVGAIIGAIVGAAIGYAVRELVQWFIEAWNDDVFPPQNIGFEIDGFWPEDSLPDGFADPTPVDFIGHDGRYMLFLNYKLIAETAVN